jgi:fermentation-respiration switch protein FrsA (DUF1100 family)
MRRNITFNSKGLRCCGWLYVPEDLEVGMKAPAIVMAHGFSAVKEQGLSDFAERFVAAGFVTLVFDYRYFGDSEGEPRSQIFPLEMVEDYRNAITWVSEQEEVDPHRIGIWGTSFSGGIVLSVGTFDKRVKAVVAQVPSTLNPESRRAINPEKWDSAGDFLLQDRIERYKTGKVNYMKVVAPEGEPCVLPGKEAFEGYMAIKELGPNWRNQVTLESLEKIREFDPVGLIHLMEPTALLLIPAEKDGLIPVHLVKETYEKAREPKAILNLPISHFEIYYEPWLPKAANAAVEWFQKHIGK